MERGAFFDGRAESFVDHLLGTKASETWEPLGDIGRTGVGAGQSTGWSAPEENSIFVNLCRSMREML